jgi:serum/glucocorticoid-regulated kinase 2
MKMMAAFQTKRKVYFVIECLNGGDMYTHLKAKIPYDENKAKFYMAEIILALEHLHARGVVYRDLKPENIMLDHEGHAKLADFGLAKLGVKANQNLKTFCGTPEYIAPEIIEGKGYTKAVDWWALGCVFYEMLAAKHPFRKKNRHEMFENIKTKPCKMLEKFSLNSQLLLMGLLAIDP